MTSAAKIVARNDLSAALAALPRPLVFTNGVFDILHPGHVQYLEDARAIGGSLMVALNTDMSVRLLGKGGDRPINPAGDRAILVAALAAVSLVTFFDDATPVRLLHEVRPDFYVKGGDYDMEQLEETHLLRSYGGEARAIAFRSNYSTSALLRRIRANQA